MTGHEQLLADSRSTRELVEAALAEVDWDDEQFETFPAIAVLQARGTREVLDTALVLCRSLDAKCRIVSAGILGQLGSPTRTFPEECCDALLDLLRHDSDENVRLKALYALGHLGNRRCEPALIALKDHSDKAVRRGVAFGLQGAESPAAIQALLELMNDPSGRVRDWATTSIGQTLSVDGPEIRSALLHRVTDGDELVRAEALHGLACRRDPRIVLYLIAELLAPRYHSYNFADAAKTYLGMNEEEKVEAEVLVAALRISRH